ncbi:hemophore-related protein [Nocardia implantans]|uniref:Hemophore-related protein n=1 Tax=Nocardia implantans TaxID=3108168 RepID=A0ABU6APA4_9NOCA|nr:MULTISPECIES: hemophore-related protein [unclassified Nocardia]MBF6189628.1 hemophore-related protein [Nocardia beijingensis]MEA3527144.1 hemophore-related protein [Nocardia sp. CDC192]MEB3509278.1 hemophore-related protein [Nocardia sp. CDC186]
MTRIVRATLALGGLLAAGALLVPATASAQPQPGGLLETTCSFAQIDAAVHAQFPDAAARLDAHPDRKAKLQEFLSLPVEQRKQRAKEFLDQHPQAKSRFEERRNSPEAQQHREKFRVIADTCHNY